MEMCPAYTCLTRCQEVTFLGRFAELRRRPISPPVLIEQHGFRQERGLLDLMRPRLWQTIALLGKHMRLSIGSDSPNAVMHIDIIDFTFGWTSGRSWRG
jgi:hypothetical protein